MSEHKYLTDSEIAQYKLIAASTRNYGMERLIEELDSLRAELAQVRASAQEALENSVSRATYNSLRAELKAAQEEIAQLKTQLHQAEIERNMASDCVKADGEQISQLTRERDGLNGALRRTQDERDLAVSEIARLRDERRLLAEVTLRQDDVITEQRDELDRMRKALCDISGARPLKDRDGVVESSSEFAWRLRGIAEKALNPQPAQQETICGFPVVISNKLASPEDKGQSVVFGPVPQEEK